MWRGSEGQREGECMLTHLHAGAEPGLVRLKAYTIFLGVGGVFIERKTTNTN